MAKIDLSVGSPLFAALDALPADGRVASGAGVTEEKVRELADGLLDSWLFWQRLFEKMGDRLLDAVGKEK